MAVVKVENKTYTVEPLYQWDKNQTLEIRGLSLTSIPEIHFANDAMSCAIVRQAAMNAAGVITAGVPNSLLQKPYTVVAYVCHYVGGTFETLYKLEIPVKARTKPGDYTLEGDDEVYSFNAIENQVANLQTKVEAATKTAKAAETTANGIAATAQAANVAAAAAQEAATAAVEAVNSKAVVGRCTATLTAEGWTEGSAPYVQTINVEGVTATDWPHITPVYSADLETAAAEKEAWAMVCDAETSDGAIRFQCFEDRPAVSINIQVEVVR